MIIKIGLLYLFLKLITCAFSALIIGHLSPHSLLFLPQSFATSLSSLIYTPSVHYSFSSCLILFSVGKDEQKNQCFFIFEQKI